MRPPNYPPTYCTLAEKSGHLRHRRYCGLDVFGIHYLVYNR